MSVNYFWYLLNPLKYPEYFNFHVTLRKKQEYVGPGGRGGGETPSGSYRISAPAWGAAGPG